MMTLVIKNLFSLMNTNGITETNQNLLLMESMLKALMQLGTTYECWRNDTHDSNQHHQIQPSSCYYATMVAEWWCKFAPQAA